MPMQFNNTSLFLPSLQLFSLCGGNGHGSELSTNQTAAENEPRNESENYVPGDSGNRIAMFPESKEVRDETKTSFNGQRVKGDSES